MGAGGRDFHNFNIFFRDDPSYRVVAFTAGQVPFIEERVYPAKLAGRLYPEGIPIVSEDRLLELIKKHEVDDVFFSYSDVSHLQVMQIASRVIAEGASFHLLGPRDTMLKSHKPIIAVAAVRTGAGKSSIVRKLVELIRGRGARVVVVRHPMAYCDLEEPFQRFQSLDDLNRVCTLEEMEELEHHLRSGVTVYTGIDYRKVLEEAEKEADVIVWDGGNNDVPFFQPDVHITVVDPLRLGHETSYYPGESNLRMAHIVVINKADLARPSELERLIRSCSATNPKARIVQVRSETNVDRPELVQGKKVLVVEDAPSLTHGGLRDGAGAELVRRLGGFLVDPRDKAVGSIKATYKKYPHIGPVLPALGYSKTQLKELQATINSVKCDAVVVATPADLTRLITINKPIARVRFEVVDHGDVSFERTVSERLKKLLRC